MTKWFTFCKWCFVLAYAISLIGFFSTNSDYWIYVNLLDAVFMFASWFYEWYYRN
jgi:hypothetical protein